MRKKAATNKPSRLNYLKSNFPYLVLAILLFLSVLAWHYYKNNTLAREERRYNEYVDFVVNKIAERLHQYEMILKGGAGVFAASEEVTREEWRAYYEYQQVGTLYPGIQRVTFSKIVRPRELAQHTEEIRAEGFPNYTVSPAGERELYAPLIYLEPFDEGARRALGFDPFSEPVRRAAIEQARDTGKAALSQMVVLVSEETQGSRPGFLMVVPVYSKGDPMPDTVEKRRAGIYGYVIGAFTMPELMTGIFTDSVHKIDFAVYDGAEVSPATMMYDSRVFPDTIDEEHRPLFTSHKTVDLHGHQWTMVFETMPAFEAVADLHTHWAVLAAGLLVSILIFLYLKSLTTTGDRAHTLAQKMTNELRESEQRTIRQRAAITELILGDIVIAGETIPALRKITEVLSGAVSVERSSIWILDESGEELQCLSLYEDKSGKHSSGTILQTKTFPRYFAAIFEESRIDAENAQQDPRTSELTEGYLKPLGITSMLDAGIIIDGKLKGVVCLEHVGDPRKWHADEEAFASTVASMAAQVFIVAGRKQLEEALQQSERKYRYLTENITDIIWTADLEGNLTYINPAVEKMLGFTPEECMAMSMDEYTVREDYDALMARLAEELAKPPEERTRSTFLEARHKTKDNHLVFVEFSASWIIDEQGNYIGVQGTTRDITARKQLEDEVRAQRDELDTLYTFSTEMRAAKNTEDLVAYTLRETCRLLQADDGMVMFLSPDKFHLTIAVGTGYFVESIGLSFPVEQGLSGQVLQTKKPVTCENYGAEPQALPLKDIDKLGPAALVPLQSEEALVGVLVITRSQESNNLIFTPAEVKTLAALGEIAGNALRRQFLFESVHKRLDQIQTLRNIDMAITGSLDLRVTFNVILDEITGLLNTDAAAIIRLEPHTGSLKYEAWRGFKHSNPAELNLRLGEGFAGHAAMNRESIHISDLKDVEADKVQGSLLEREGFMAYYAVPLIAKGHVQGVLEIYHREPFHSNGDWLAFLETLAGQAAVAIDNVELFHKLERFNVDLLRAYDATIEGWAYALDLKDEETEGHSRRVTEMTVDIAREMGVNDEELAHVYRGALLHDIGKMGIPDAILLKPGKLNDEEWESVKKHPVYAYEMLAPIEYLRQALDIPYCHHEKWDGSGYPRGLKGKEIPLPARIFAVVDVYDALTSDRLYRKAWSREEALEHIRKESGKHFDPEVVEVFLEVIGDTVPK